MVRSRRQRGATAPGTGVALVRPWLLVCASACASACAGGVPDGEAGAGAVPAASVTLFIGRQGAAGVRIATPDTAFVADSYLQAGDSAELGAQASDAAGGFVWGGAPPAFAVSDAAVARVGGPAAGGTARGGRGAPGAVLHALRPGLVTVTARLAGGRGAATVRVLPRLARVAVTPARATVAVGDTVALRAVAVDAAGRAVPGLQITYRADRYGSLAGGGLVPRPVARFVARAPGVTRVTASVAGATGAAVLVIRPRR